MSAKAFGRKDLDRLVGRVVDTYQDDRGINHLEGLPIPDRNGILACLDDLLFVLFPGFTDSRPVSHVNVASMVGSVLYSVCRALAREIETAFHYQCRLTRCDRCDCEAVAAHTAAELLAALPRIRETLKTDVAAAFVHDPAATSYDEIILAYPGIRAIAIHRIAHELYRLKVPLIPRIINEHAHGLTGIDIHPGARIGESFFIDHGTGVVIGESTVIGRNVSVYHGVTLGAMGAAKGQSIRGQKRHPTIEDDVVIYPGATILGGETVIGRGCTIGGNVWLTESVPPYTLVTVASPELVFRDKKSRPPVPSSEDPVGERQWRCPARELCDSGACPAERCPSPSVQATKKKRRAKKGSAPSKTKKQTKKQTKKASRAKASGRRR